jgi:hypothetical protein
VGHYVAETSGASRPCMALVLDGRVRQGKEPGHGGSRRWALQVVWGLERRVCRGTVLLGAPWYGMHGAPSRREPSWGAIGAWSGSACHAEVCCGRAWVGGGWRGEQGHSAEPGHGGSCRRALWTDRYVMSGSVGRARSGARRTEPGHGGSCRRALSGSGRVRLALKGAAPRGTAGQVRQGTEPGHGGSCRRAPVVVVG